MFDFLYEISFSKILIFLIKILPLIAFVVAIILLLTSGVALTLSPQSCEVLFDCTPKEFLDADLELYDITGDLSKGARVDRHGNLKLKLKRDQVDDWVFYLQQDVNRTNMKNTNIDVSNDFFTITVYGYMETYIADLEVADELRHKTSVIRYLTSQDGTYEVLLVDGVTGEVVMTFGFDANGEFYQHGNQDHRFMSIEYKK